MNTREKIGIGIVIILGAFLAAKKKSTSTKNKPIYKADDLYLLQPAFRKKIELLLTQLKAEGWDPIPRDTGRTQAEANKFTEKGTGIKDSLHLTGAAVDIISASKGWSDIEFFKAVGKKGKALGLTWGGNKKLYGGDFPTKNDLPHLQAIPIALQNQYRALTSNTARDKFIELYFAETEQDPSLIV